MHWLDIVAVLFLMTLYIFADSYLDANPKPRSIKALVRTSGFYIFYGIFAALNFSAYYVLREHVVPKGTPFFLIALASTFGCVTVLQSLGFKIGDQKLLDVGQFVESYRKTVFEQAIEKHAELQHARDVRLTDRLAEHYEGDLDLLISDLKFVAGYGKDKETNEEIEKYIQTEKAAAPSEYAFRRTLSSRIVATDPVAVARVFLKRKKNKKKTIGAGAGSSGSST